MSNLRHRRHLETKAALVKATFRLLHDAHFGALTMEQVAETAGVSRSTAYRRFGSKEEIIREVPRQWQTAWDDAQARLDPDATLITAMSEGSLAVARKIDEDHELVLLAYRAMSESPALQSSGANSAEWIERMTDTIVSHEPQVDQFEGRILAGAWMGAIDAMMMTWVESGGQGSVVALTQKLIDRLEALLQ